MATSAPTTSLHNPPTDTPTLHLLLHQPPQTDTVQCYSSPPLASMLPSAHTSPSAHSHSCQTKMRSSVRGTSSLRHMNKPIRYMPNRALSPSTSLPPPHQRHTTHPGRQFRITRATQELASSSSHRPTTPSYKSTQSHSCMFLSSSSVRRLPQPIVRGHYSKRRSMLLRCRIFASRLRLPNSHRHETMPGSYFQ